VEITDEGNQACSFVLSVKAVYAELNSVPFCGETGIDEDDDDDDDNELKILIKK
jgi:hypothetical protein